MLLQVVQLLADPEFIASTLRLAVPLLLAALGGLVVESSGVLSLGLEGYMLAGAFFGYLGALYSGSAVVGALAAMAGGMAMASVHALMALWFRADQIVSALGVNMLALGLTSSLFRMIFGRDLKQITSPGFAQLSWGPLSDIPFLGHALFRHTALVYLAILLVPLFHFALYKSTWGLTIRATGEHPKAVDTVGLNVVSVRLAAILFSGALAGLGGAAITLTGINNFLDNMTAGRGYIAFAAIVFGKWTPVGAGIAALLFGGGDALQLRLQAFGVPLPYQILQMLPYGLTLLILVFFMGPSRGPSASGQPYARDSR